MPFGASTPEPPPGMAPGEHEIIHVDDRVVACDGGNPVIRYGMRLRSP